MTFAEIQRKVWDIVIVGTGMGGATLGHSLAKSGKDVLFIEKGNCPTSEKDALRGCYPELSQTATRYQHNEDSALLKAGGRFWDTISDVSGSKPQEFVPFIGCGAGGSSSLYGMALERLFPEDFYPRQKHPNSPQANLPEAWPVNYDELAPYYTAAEKLYRVRGARDPLRPAQEYRGIGEPPELSTHNKKLFQKFVDNGLNPYQIPMACDFVDGCEECQGYLCARGCKNDARKICLKPAIDDFGATVVDQCEVVGLEADAQKVKTVHCSRLGEAFVVRVKTVVLAAGALVTPAILLRSSSHDWPEGLANGSRMVGKNLMRHFVDLYATFPDFSIKTNEMSKQVAINDFYLSATGGFGTLQSFGYMTPGALIVQEIQEDLANSSKLGAALFGFIKRAPASVLDQMFKRALVLASIAEDLPYISNHVSLGNSNGLVELNYAVAALDKERMQRFSIQVSRALKGVPRIAIRQSSNNKRIAHALGTCRFGIDPKTSVLNAYNRSHEVPNLFVVDGSFFPSSGGTNPSLTIAANSLRVAEYILAS